MYSAAFASMLFSSIETNNAVARRLYNSTFSSVSGSWDSSGIPLSYVILLRLCNLLHGRTRINGALRPKRLITVSANRILLVTVANAKKGWTR